MGLKMSATLVICMWVIFLISFLSWRLDIFGPILLLLSTMVQSPSLAGRSGGRADSVDTASCKELMAVSQDSSSSETTTSRNFHIWRT